MSTINIIKQTISLDITTALRRMAGVHNISEPDLLAQELLVHLGIVDRETVPIKTTVEVVPPPPTTSGSDADAEAESVGKKERSRMVSAKQKKPVLEQFPDTAEKKVMDVLLKGYKAATQAEIDSLMTPNSKENAFLLYVQKVRAVPAPAPAAAAAVPEVKEKKVKAKKEVGRVKFNATELKIFKKIVESAGSTVTDGLKQEFVDYVAAKSEEEFAVVALEGHMRAFVEAKKQVAVEPKAGNGELTPSEYDAARKGKGPEYDTEDEDEDLVEFTHNEETLLKGVVSGKIFRSTAEAGDVQVGVAGQGQFKDVKV